MGNIAGLISGAIFLLLTTNLIPYFYLELYEQVGAVVILSVANLLLWKESKLPPMNVYHGLKNIFFGFGIVIVLTFFDILMGFLVGERTLVGAFLHSGPLGGIADIFIIGGLVFFGLPAIVRSLFKYYFEK